MFCEDTLCQWNQMLFLRGTPVGKHFKNFQITSHLIRHLGSSKTLNHFPFPVPVISACQSVTKQEVLSNVNSKKKIFITVCDTEKRNANGSQWLKTFKYAQEFGGSSVFSSSPYFSESYRTFLIYMENIYSENCSFRILGYFSFSVLVQTKK